MRCAFDIFFIRLWVFFASYHKVHTAITVTVTVAFHAGCVEGMCYDVLIVKTYISI